MEYPTPAPNFPHAQVPLINQGEYMRNLASRFIRLIIQKGDQPQIYHDEGFQDFRDFVNFIDGVGLSAQWSPEFGVDWLQAGEQQQYQHEVHNEQPPRRHSREPEVTHSSEPEEIGTPFSTWLPSAPADDQVYLRSHAGDGM
jgi:hypothetical protein